MMNRKLTAMVCFLSLMVYGSVAPASPQQDQQRVARLLLSYDSPPDRKILEGAAKDPVGALIALASDASTLSVVRLRALDAMGLFPGLRVRKQLHTALNKPEASMETRAHAATALAFAFKGGALPSLRPWLLTPDAPLKLAVADALVRHAGMTGRRAVQQALVEEKLPSVARALESLLRPQGEGARPSIR